MSNTCHNKVLIDLKNKKCHLCESYQRKIREIEETLAGRETLITLLQHQLKKYETNYQLLYDDFEQLRCDHCSILQENSSLHEINKKLEQLSFKKTNSLKDNCSQYDRGQSHCEHNEKEVCQECENPIFKEVNKIEKLVNNQNQILKQLLDQIIGEIKSCKSSHLICAQSYHTNPESGGHIESGDYLGKDPKVKELLNQIDNYKAVLDKTKEENDCIKQLLCEKKSHLGECRSLTPSTFRSTNQCSGVVELLKPKDSCCADNLPKGAILHCQSINMDDLSYKNKLTRVKLEMEQKEKEFEFCRCQMVNEMSEISSHNQMLSDTLDIMKAENRSNLDNLTKLKVEIKKIQEENELKQIEMKYQISDLENALEQSKHNEKKLKEQMEYDETQTNKLKDRMQALVEENNSLKECKCDAEYALKTKIAELQTVNDDLRHELTEKTLELTEYEEENRAIKQSVDCCKSQNEDLQRKILELQRELCEKTKQVKSIAINTQKEMAAELHNRELTKQLQTLKEKNAYLAEDCKAAKNAMNQAGMETDYLKKSLRHQINELDKLNRENEMLQDQIARQKVESKKETERLQGLVNNSQRQVEMLLKEHDGKTAQIQAVANELNTIRTSVAEENNTYLAQIDQLKQERDMLKKMVKRYEQEFQAAKDCQCEGARNDIDMLKTEVVKKQCVILELEKTMDNFNATFKQYEQSMEELTCENACLKSAIQKHGSDLENLQKQLNEKIGDIQMLREQLTKSERACQNISKTSQNLELDNEKLKKDIGRLKSDQIKIKRALETDNLELQMELENVKQDLNTANSKLTQRLLSCQQAYNDLLNDCSRKCFENQKTTGELQNSKKFSDDLKKKCQSLQCENDQIRNECRQKAEECCKLSEQIDRLKESCNKMQRECTKKCVETEDLKERFGEQRRGSCKLEKENEDLRKKSIKSEKDFSSLNEKYNELKREYDDINQELKKLKKQGESYSRQSQISKEEYANLKKEYKAIKSMLTDQIKKCKKEANTVDQSQPEPPCEIITDLKKQLFEKSNQLIALQQKLKDCSYEIIELKDYIHKLISDNNILKSAINNLIGNLERKIKGPSFGSIPPDSADAIAGEILQSLTTIETKIMRNFPNCYEGCQNAECSCLSEIQAKYNNQGSSSKNLAKDIDCCSDCCMGKFIAANTPKGKKPVSRLSPYFGTDSSTTDTDEACHCESVLNSTSMDFFKDAIDGLKSSKDKTMKEKSCDCETRSN